MLNALFVWFLLLAATAVPAAGQSPIRVDGTVMWISGHTLTLRSDVPSAPGYQIIGQYAVPVPGPPPSPAISTSSRRPITHICGRANA